MAGYGHAYVRREAIASASCIPRGPMGAAEINRISATTPTCVHWPDYTIVAAVVIRITGICYSTILK